jgi:hypothetical protein
MAFAKSPASDTDYIAASRCRGIATALGNVDTTRLDAFLQAESGAREPFILQRGAAEYKRAQQQTDKARLAADYAGACKAFSTPAQVTDR